MTIVSMFLARVVSVGRRGLVGRLAFAAGVLLAGEAQAQAVPRTVLVEHFTNTVCSICASRNPGFYVNLRQQARPVLHIAYHPSSPYRSCLFSQQNVVENDARTNFYGIYGGTPRLVLNGTVVSANDNYAAAALFAPAQNQTSPFAVTATLQAQGNDSIVARIRIETRAANAFSTLKLYVPLAEDTVFYTGPNGETRHYDVFRKSFTGSQPLTFVPAAVRGSVVVRRAIFKNPAWVARRLYALAIVQQATNEVLQAAASPLLGAAPLAATPTRAAGTAPQLYPNPVRETLFIAPATREPIVDWQVQNVLGQIIMRSQSGISLVAVDVRNLAAGPYVLRVRTLAGQGYAVKFAKG